ncbi:MAG: hypothetical protein ACPGVU_07445 [Limisphaerales bacterium]
MEREFYLSFEGKDARIFLQSPRPKTREIKRGSPNNLDLAAVRITNGINALEASEETIEAMRKADPEIDLQAIGGILDTTTRAYYDRDTKEVATNFQVFNVALNPDGSEKERKLFTPRHQNTNHETNPVKIGKLVPRAALFKKFVISGAHQLVHADGVQYEFLHGIAKSLADKQQAALLGAGTKGNAPLVFQENGRTIRCALTGEVDGENYKLLILQLGQELKLPAGRKEEA